MKEPSAKSAFTLVELLLVLFAIGFLVMLFLPSLATTHGPVPYTSWCVNNQKQLALGFTVWKDDHNGKLPWQVSTTNGGMMEFVPSGQAAPQFKAQLDLWKEDPNTKNPLKLFVCPADRIKHAATDAATFSDANVSYFVNVDSDANQTNTILIGDRLLEANGHPVPPGLFKYSKGDAMTWDPKLHQAKGLFDNHGSSRGVLGFVDGHVAIVRPSDLTSVFERQGSMTNRLAIP